MKTKVAQVILRRAGFYMGKIDGDFGRKSELAARKYYDFESDWDNLRLAIGVIQVYAVRNNVATGGIDGYWGQNTEGAFKNIIKILEADLKKYSVAPAELVEVKPLANVKKRYNGWPSPNYNELVAFYGKVGENQTSLILPYEMRLAWDLDTKIKKFTCHKKVKDSLDRIFKSTLDHYGLETIKQLHLDRFGGCLNVRKMRGGSSWSMHSWGIAVDLDPDRNQLRWGRDKAVFAKKEYEPFWQIVEAEGWTSLGRKKNYDWMHLQATSS